MVERVHTGVADGLYCMNRTMGTSYTHTNGHDQSLSRGGLCGSDGHGVDRDLLQRHHRVGVVLPGHVDDLGVAVVPGPLRRLSLHHVQPP